MPTHCIAERSPRVWHETHPYCIGCAQHTERPSLEADWIKPELEHLGSGVFVCPNFVALPIEETPRTAVAADSVSVTESGVCSVAHAQSMGDACAAHKPQTLGGSHAA